MKYFIVAALSLLVIGGVWWTMHTPSAAVSESEALPLVENDISAGDTQPADSMQNTEAENSGDTQTVHTLNVLTTETWVWQETLMNNGDVTTPAEADAFTLTFTEDGQVSGTTDCNSLNGQYELNDTSISMGPFAMTKMYCEGSQEHVFVEALTEASSVFFDEADNLVLLLPYDSGSVVFAPQTN